MGQRHRPGADHAANGAPGVDLPVDRAVADGVLVHHDGRSHPRRPRPEGEGTAMSTPLLEVKTPELASAPQTAADQPLRGGTFTLRPASSLATAAKPGPGRRRPHH